MNAQPKFKEYFQRRAYETVLKTQKFDGGADYTLLEAYQRDKSVFLAMAEIELNSFKTYILNTVKTVQTDSAEALLYVVYKKTVDYYLEKDRILFIKQLNTITLQERIDDGVLDIKKAVQDVNFEIISEVKSKIPETNNGLHVNCQTVILHYFAMLNGFLNWMFANADNEDNIRARAEQVWKAFCTTL